MVSFENVSKFILKDVTIHIPKGVAVGLIGTSGAGKTTFLRLACGLLVPKQGEVHTLQKNPVKYRELLGRNVGSLLERMPQLDGWRSVADNFRDLQIIHRMTEAEFQDAYEALAQRFGMKEYENEAVKELSLGQRRRAELAAVFLHQPKLLLLDEPTNGLDENAKQVFRELLKERVQEGATVVMASHDMHEVSGICQRIAVLEQGKLLYYGEETNLMRRFAPMDSMRVRIGGKLPDMEDLPLKSYRIEEDEVTLVYDSNYITAAEILEVVLRQTSVKEVSIRKPGLEDVIMEIKRKVTGGWKNELY